MREIKYRAWHGRGQMVCPPFNLHIKDHMTMFMDESGLFGYHGSSTTLMQYTGLKDKNGVEIYEGDIVQYVPWGRVSPVKDVIKWDDQYHGYRIDRPVPGHEWEVIGNVHEDPDLIK